MKKVICFGTFDLLHLGHLHYFQQAKQYGNHLTVVIARDKTKEKQGKSIIFSEEERKELLDHLTIVDEVVLGYYDDHFKIIQEINPDVLCLGYDHDENKVKQKLLELGIKAEIKSISPYKEKKHKSTHIRKTILSKF